MTSAEVVGSRVSRRARARLLVPLDGTMASSAELMRALRDAVRQDGSVLACAVIGGRTDDVEREVLRAAVEDQVARAVEATGVRGRTEIALLDAAVFEALCGVARGGTLVVVQENRRTVLRSAAPRAPVRPIARHG
ncbi:hypothetical protein [Modestobacter sp. KNN46-3]|uniref:hypothetical protein n=1 Tax=Modestobacter sp. KNN46-3 TaxID=2711218 RepID=UPI0013DFF5E8|nr:hypothetical protein [Modestobacter sp. KNN46-3]